MQIVGNMNFSQWFKRNLKDSARDIANHGADAGYPHISYTSDCVKLYNRFEEEIYEASNQDAEEFGMDSVDALVATFRRKDMLSTPDQRKNLLLWYMVEREARNYE